MKKLTRLHISLGFLALLPLILTLSSCNSTKRLSEGEILLDKNSIVTKSIKLDKGEMEAYLKQKPNRKIIFWKFYLHVYNSVNQEKMAKKKMQINARKESVNSQRIEKNNRINLKREAKGKKLKKPFLKKLNRRTRREVILSIGEAPVVYDSLLARKSARQINLYLNNKGYFNSKVKDSLSVRNRKASVHYIVHAGKPYTFRKVSYDIKDNQLSYYVLSDAPATLVKKGMNYDVETLQNERDRITTMLRNDGYFLFSKEYIYFEIDSALGTHEVDIRIGIKNPVIKIEGTDSTTELAHSRFYIKNIYIDTDYDPKVKTASKDTLLINDYYLMSSSTEGPRYRPRLITDAIFISKGELYQQSHADQTYRRLTELKLFRSVQLQFVKISSTEVDCYVYLSNIPKQSFSAETEGTNTSGTLGIAGSLVYQNKNTFKGGEIFEIKLKGALEVQKTKNKEENLILTGIESPIPFNTLELGSEVNLYIPRFVTPLKIKTPKNNNAKTNLTATFNFQRRPDYGRSIANTAFGYSWNETSTKKHIINPIELNLVNIFDDSTLQATINNSKDLFLRNSYSDHFTLGSRYTFIFSNQNIRKQKSFSYMRFGAEGSGNAMRGVFVLIDKNHPLDYNPEIVVNTDNSVDTVKNYTIEQIPFSQYVRTDIDYRYYKFINDRDKLVFRFACGVGKPLYNLRVLPLEKSFFAGGPNSVRAWQARTLGPGGFSDADNTNYADKIGDVKIETNIEYRFKVIRILNAALFVDAGNIWMRKTYPSYPNGKFSFLGDDEVGSFIYQMAIGAGVGIRLDFNFFIFRLDGAFKVKDPARPSGDRWMINKPLETVLNFGIGYPF